MAGGLEASRGKVEITWRYRLRLLGIAALLLMPVSALFLPAPAQAEPGWELILDRPSPDFRGMDFVSDDEGWLVAGAGLLHTTDAGATWQEAAPLLGIDVDFADAAHGWLVGWSGRIFATTDGGANWSQQESGTDVHLQDVFAVNAEEAWAVGRGQGFSDVVLRPFASALLHTVDGGATWDQVEIPRRSELGAITFVGQRGWVFGECVSRSLPETPGEPDCGDDSVVILRTDDAGVTWEQLEVDRPGAFAGGFTFVSEQRGWVIAAGGGLFLTDDGGSSWRTAEAAPVVPFQDIAFRDELRGWAVSRQFCLQERCPIVLYRTVDGGQSWTSSPVGADRGPFPSLRLVAGVQAVYLVGPSPSHVMEPPVMLRSIDGGESWLQMDHPALDLSQIEFVDSEIGYAVAGTELLRTEDAGKSWQVVAPLPADLDFRRIDFPNEERGFVTGFHCADRCQQAVHRTTDGGRSWEVVLSGLAGGGVLQFIDESTGWLLQGDGFLLTHDGGENWTRRELPRSLARSVLRADLVTASEAWAVTEGPKRLIHTRDGGRTWNIAPGTAGRGVPTRVDFVDRDHGWYVAENCPVGRCDDTLFRTTNGGASWVELSLPGGRALAVTLAFADRLNGWVDVFVCDLDCASHLLHTADGGQTWEIQLDRETFAGDLVVLDARSAWLLLRTDRLEGIGGGPPARLQIFHTADAGGGPIGGPITGGVDTVGGKRSRFEFGLALAIVGATLGVGALLAARRLYRS